MGPPHDNSDSEGADRSDGRPDKPDLAATDPRVLLDHHLEELQAALDELARRHG